MILGIPIVLIIAVAVYMISTVVATEFLKKFLLINPLILSWAVGTLLYTALALLRLYAVDVVNVAVFIVVTGLLNFGYKRFDGLRKAAKWIVGKVL